MVFKVLIKYVHIFIWISEWGGGVHLWLLRAPSHLSQSLVRILIGSLNNHPDNSKLCMRTKCWGEYLGLTGGKCQEVGENCIMKSFTFVFFAKYYYGNDTKENKMLGAWFRYKRYSKHVQILIEDWREEVISET
jgi:hypothetical protein